MKNVLSVSLLTLTALASMAYAQEGAQPLSPVQAIAAAAAAVDAQIPAEAVQEVNRAVTTHVKPTAKGMVAKDIDAYLKETGIKLGEATPSGAVYLKGIAGVMANVNDPNFVRSRSMAYERAYQQALFGYVMDKFGKETANQSMKTFSDRSSNRLMPSSDVKSTVDRIAEKTDQLQEAELDAKLREMGKVPAGAVVEKRRLLQDSLVKKSMDRAVGASAGVLAVQTFEGWTEDGKYAVGVVLRGGTDTELIAEALRYKQRPLLSRPEAGISVDEALPNDDELVSQFGVRMFFDKNGTPALLSFGQWGSAYTGTDADEAEEAMDHAMEQAEAIANENLTLFINSSITLLKESEKSEDKTRDALFDENGVPQEAKVQEYIDRVSKSAETAGQDTMIGRSTVCKKVVVHPANGRKLAVVVRMWSFGQYEAMKRIIERPKPAVQVPAPAVNQPGPAGIRRGKNYDF